MEDTLKENWLTPELQQQLHTIDQSQFYILIIILSVCLSYYNISIQKEQLICTSKGTCPECLPKTFPLQITSSLLVIMALFFFYGLSEQTLCLPDQSCTQQISGQRNHTASLLVLLAALVRFGDLLSVNCRPDSSEEPAGTEEKNEQEEYEEILADVEPDV